MRASGRSTSWCSSSTPPARPRPAPGVAPATDPAGVPLTVSVEEIRHQKEDTGWLVAYVRVLAGPGRLPNTLILLTGVLPSLYPGCCLDVVAVEDDNPRWGRQWKVLHAVPRLPFDEAGMRRYLEGAFKTVGPKRSAAIWAAWGMDSPAVLDSSEAVVRLAAEAGIPAGFGTGIVAQWQRQSAERAALLTLASAGLSMSQCLKVSRHFGKDTGAILATDPYRLLEVDGIRFSVADSVALRTNLAPADPRRLEAALAETARAAAQRQGHCWTAVIPATEGASVLIGQEAALFAPVVSARRAEAGALVAVCRDQVWPTALLRAETELAAHLQTLQMAPIPALRLNDAAWSEIFGGQRNVAGDRITLSGEQQAAVRFLVEQPVAALTGGPGTGKALALDTPIPTPQGWSTMGALRVGDLVYDERGYPCQVTFATDTMYDHACYEVTFDDGTTIVADADHLWLTHTRASRKSAGRALVRDTHRLGGTDQRAKRILPGVSTTVQIQTTLRTGSDDRLNHSIPLAGALCGIDMDLPVDPYVLGYWLGNGNTHTAEITTIDTWVLEEIRRRGYGVVECAAARKGECGRYALRRPDGKRLGQKLVQLHVLHHKHIPAQYLQASITQRLALLQGLMDSDGSVGKGGRCEIAVVRSELAAGIHELVLSLGIKAHQDARPAKIGDKVCGTAYRTSFTTTLPVFRLPRKRERLPTVVRSSTQQRYIQAVRPVASVPVRCIQVSSPSHLYLASHACIPTHNTTVLRSVLYALRAGGLGNIRLAAPTGKAARRMHETTGAPAGTIHSLLNEIGDEGTLPVNVVLVDEASMLDLPLAHRLVTACAPGTRLLLIGDTDQLPSVGPGRVLADLLAAPIPEAHLSVVFRQAATSAIIQAAYSIIDGATPALPVATGALADVAGDAVLVDAPTEREIIRQAVVLVSETIPAAYGIAPSDIRVLCPTYKGEAGIHRLNAALQAVLNPPAPGKAELAWSEVEVQDRSKQKRILRVGDRLLWLENNKELQLVNGSEVEVVALNPDSRTVTLRSLDEENALVLPPLRLAEVEAMHAFAMTVHKSQGSEYACAVVICHAAHSFAGRRLIYTAITRAKGHLVVLGTLGALAKMVGRNHDDGRRTDLIARLRAHSAALVAA